MGTANMHRTVKGNKATYGVRLLLDDNNDFQAFWEHKPEIFSSKWGTEEEALLELVYMIEEE